jgi:ATP-binding protein involved in chromosome partitioning
MNQEQIYTLLDSVLDPNTGRGLHTAGLIRDLKVEGNNCSFTIVSQNFTQEIKGKLSEGCQKVLLSQYPEIDVNIHFIQAGPQDSVPLAQVRNIIAVASGKGGVGKSTVSVNLALALRQLGARVGLIDADLYGPSIPTMMGLTGQRPKMTELYGSPKIVPLEAYGIPVISIGFLLEPEQAVVLRGPRLSAIIKQFFNDILWPELDYLIVDLPPGTGDIQLSLVQTVPVTGVVMVTTPQEVALIDAVKAMNMFLLPQIDVPIIGVVENMSWFTPAELPDNKYYIFGNGGGSKLAKMSESVLLGQIPIVQGIREGGDQGSPVVFDKENPLSNIFSEIAKKTMVQIARRHETIAPTKKVDIS